MDLDHARRRIESIAVEGDNGQLVEVVLELLTLAGQLDQKLSEVEYHKNILERRLEQVEQGKIVVAVDGSTWPDQVYWRCTCGFGCRTAGEMFTHLSTAHAMDEGDPALLGDPRR